VERDKEQKNLKKQFFDKN